MNFPSVTRDILARLSGNGSAYMQPKHQRRGRLVHDRCHWIGKGIEIDAEWFDGHSGEGEHDRVEHRGTIPYIDGYRKFKRDHPHLFPIKACEVEVVNEVEHYVGHIDQIMADDSELDIKTGKAPEWARLQTALYNLARSSGHAMNVSRTETWTRPNRRVLELPGDGDYRFIEHKEYRDLAQAVVLARAWWIIKQYGGE